MTSTKTIYFYKTKKRVHMYRYQKSGFESLFVIKGRTIPPTSTAEEPRVTAYRTVPFQLPRKPSYLYTEVDDSQKNWGMLRVCY